MANEMTQNVRCDACGCAFTPEILKEREKGIEFTFFRCDYCGKAYMVTVTDQPLRRDIARYEALARRNRIKRLSEKEQREAIRLKADNLKRARELRAKYIKDDPQNTKQGGPHEKC